MSASHNVKTLVVFCTLILCCPSFIYAVLNWEIQRYDGWYNNLAYHSRGTVDSPFVRLLPARYADGVYQVLLEPELPNPRKISNVAMKGKSGISCSKNRNVLFVYFGYLVMDEILEVIGTGCPTEFLNIQVPSGDPIFDPNSTGKVELPFQRSRWSIISGQSPNNPRVQINHATTWIDGSSIYGASRTWSDTLRTFSDGLLASGTDKNLPRLSNGLINLWKFVDPATGQRGLNGLYDFGNAKANESPFLRAQNIIWFRYHNYLAAQLQAQNPKWTDEELFQNARKLVIGTFQHILYYEWLPVFIGQDMSPYEGYKKYVDPSISPEFQAAAIRILNSMIPPGIYMRNSTCHFRKVVNVYNRMDPALRVCNNFWSRENPNFKNAKDIDELILGMISQRAEQEDNIVVTDLRDFMYGPLRFTRSDVVALDIQRGRDNGLPSYNQVREALDLEPVKNWSNINADLYRENPKLINQLAALYNNDISRLELFVGGMLENRDNSSRLFTAIIKKQFEHIRDGDRFWFENTKNGIFTEAELRSIWNTTFKDVLLATIAEPGNIQKDVFYLKDDDPCVQRKQLTDSDMEPCVKVSTLHYFDGSGAGFGILIAALCCFPLAALLLAFTISLSRKREKKRLQNMKASLKKQISPGGKIQASEWQGPKEAIRNVSIILHSNKCIKVMDSKHSVIRNIRLSNGSHFDIIQSTNKEQKALLLKVPKEYDLVLMFHNEDERNEFVADLKKYLDNYGIHLLVHEVRERTLLKEAVTKQQRIKILDTFFRRVFAQVLEIDGSDAGDFDNETQKKAKESLNCELTPAEFADALGIKEDSMFVEQMFMLADKDGNGYLSFLEFMDIFVILMKGSPEEKSRLMFNMYDVDGSGSMSKEEFLQLLRSFIEISNNCLSKDQTQEVMESMFKEAGFEDKEELMWEDFHYLFRDHYNELELAQLNVKGVEGQKRDKSDRVSFIIKKKRSEKTEPTEGSKENGNKLETHLSINQEGFVMDLRKRFGKKSSQPPRRVFAEAKREKYTKNKFQQKVQEGIQYVQNYQRQIFCTIIFFGITAGVFVERAYYYAVLREHSGVPQTTRVGLIIARGSAAAVSFMYSYLLLTMCRNLITVLRETFLNRYIPFDSAVDFHRWVAMAAAFFSVLHSAAHAVNIYAFSANPLNVLACLFPEAVYDDGSELPLKYYWWFFQNITGMTGVLLLFFFSFLHIFALHYFRRISFRAFWVSHHLYIGIYILILLHGSAALLQPQRFHIYLIIPTLIFVGDKFVSYSRKKIEIAVVNAQLLPSGVTYLEFKRPRDFDYLSGQWVRIASLVLGTNEYHPFTLTSAPHENTLSLHIRAVGPWTMRLREIYSPESRSTLGSYPKIYLDGPFGEGHQEWNKFEVSVLVGGGIGVTPFASILKDLVYKSTIKDKISCKKIYFIWVTRTQRQFEWLEDIIREVEATDKKCLVSVHIYITQLAEKFDLRTTMLYICERHFQKISNRSLFTGLQSITHFGRPQFIPFFSSLVDVHPETSKIGVFSCGPPGMTRNVEKACKQMNKRHKIRFQHHYENF